MTTYRTAAHAASDPDREYREAGVDLVDIDAPRRQREKSPPEKFMLGVMAVMGLSMGALMLVVGLTADTAMALVGAVVFGFGWSAALAWLIVGALRAN
jgi:hypothetical protein